MCAIPAHMTLSTGVLSNLFWIQTLTHTRDCFVVAESGAQAQQFFEHKYGFSEGCSRAELVMTVPETSHKAFAPSEDQIACYGIRTYASGAFEWAGRFFISDPPDLSADCPLRSPPQKAQVATKATASVTVIKKRSATQADPLEAERREW